MQGEVYEAHEVAAVAVVGWEEVGGRRAVVGRAAGHCVERALHHRCWACLVSACKTHGMAWEGKHEEGKKQALADRCAGSCPAPA